MASGYKVLSLAVCIQCRPTLISHSNYCTKSDCKLFQQMEERGEIILTNLRSNGTIIMGDMNKIHCIYVVVDDGCQN